MPVHAGRLVDLEAKEQLIARALRRNTYFTCHQAMLAGRDVCCRGFFEHNNTAVTGLAKALGLVRFVGLEEIMKPEIKTLADLKRFIKPGVQIRMVRAVYGPIAAEKQLGTIEKAQSNAFAARSPGEARLWWHTYHKAGEYTFTPDGFSVGASVYEYVDQPE